jgi:hypothetical protein
LATAILQVEEIARYGGDNEENYSKPVLFFDDSQNSYNFNEMVL